MKRLLIAGLWAYSLLHFYATGVRQALRLFTSDFLAAFPTYQVARFVGRLDLYRGSLAEQWGPPPVWHYGPVLHLITLPLFAFDTLRGAFTFWLLVNYALVAAILVLLVLELDGWRPTLSTTSIVVIAALNFNPLYEALTIRAIEIFELLLILAAFALYRRGRSASAGIAIGIAAMSKFLPLIFLPYFALKRDWRALGSSMATVAIIALATQWTLGWEHSGTFHQLTAPHGSVISFEENQSLAGFVLRLVAWTGAPLDGVLASRIAIALGLAALSILFLMRVGPGEGTRTRVDRDERTRTRVDGADATRTRVDRADATRTRVDGADATRTRVDGADATRTGGDEACEWWLLVTAAVLLPPHNQNYYAVLILPAYLILFLRFSRSGLLRSSRALTLYTSFLLVGLPIPLSLLNRLARTPIWPLYLRSATAFLAMTLLALLLAYEVATTHARRAELAATTP